MKERGEKRSKCEISIKQEKRGGSGRGKSRLPKSGGRVMILKRTQKNNCEFIHGRGGKEG